jgi:hypothetical protein
MADRFRITIVVADEELAKEIVEDTQETDSMCLTLENGDELEFGIVTIEYEKVDA